MSKVLIILRHEFWGTVRRKIYILVTFGLPALGLILVLALQLLTGQSEEVISAAETRTVGYVDRTSLFSKYRKQDQTIFVQFATQEEAKSALLSGQVQEYYVIPSDYLATGTVARYSIKRGLDASTMRDGSLESFFISNLLEGKVPPDLVARVKAPATVVPVVVSEDGQTSQGDSTLLSMITPYIFGVLLAIAIFSSAGFLLQGLVDEKENRVIEILLSSVSAQQLLIGKILGLGAAGLLQMIVWVAAGRAIATFTATPSLLGNISIPPLVMALGLVYFVLGYLLFAALMASVGSLGTTMRESQQLGSLFSLSAALPIILSGFLLNNPDHPVARAMSFFPLTSPMTVMLRLGMTEVPAWEWALSIVILLGSVVLAFIGAAKIFRTTLLMYGKRPSVREIVRYLREA